MNNPLLTVDGEIVYDEIIEDVVDLNYYRKLDTLPINPLSFLFGLSEEEILSLTEESALVNGLWCFNGDLYERIEDENNTSN